MNFGHGIAIALIAFIIFIMTLVTSFIRQDVDLEYTDYYSRELVFNETKEATENALPYLNNLEIECEAGQLNLFFDETFPPFEAAELHFYRAENADFDLNFTIPQGRLHQFPLEQFQKGKYELRMEWTVGDKPFALRKTFWVSK